MRKLLLFLLSATMLYSCFLTKSPRAREREREREEEEREKYDNPMLRDQQAAEMIKDPALGYVPYNRLLAAIDQTIALKSASRPPHDATNNLLGDPLIWQERGPIYDSVGPSNGNGRGGGTGSTAGGHTSGRIRAFLLDTLNDPTGNTAFTGGVAGGLWKCTNFLSTINNWTLINDRFDNLAISSLCQDPTNPSIIYFSTGEPTDNADRVTGAGVWKSTDGGNTFNYLPATANYMRCFKVGCDAAGNVYLACRTTTVPVNQQSGLFRSTNGGTTWTDITPNNLDPNSNASCTDFEFTASGKLNAMFGYRPGGNVVNHRYTNNPATVTAATWLNSTGFRTTNAPAIRTEMAVSGDVLYAVTINPAYNTDSCYKSTDGGVTWTKQNTTVMPSGLGNGQGWYSISLAINPVNTNELFCGGLDAYRSVNSGATWTRFTFWVSTAPYVHADHHYGQYWIAGGQTRMIMCTDGGVFYSANNGTNFTAKNRNLGIKQFYSGAIHPAAGSPVLLAGAQDNGTHQLRNPGLSYSWEVTGGDGCIVHINQQNPLIQFGSYVYNDYRRTTNGGTSWSNATLSSSQGLFVNPFTYDDGQNILYASNGPLGEIRRWLNANTAAANTSTRIAISNIGATTSLTSLKMSPYTANRVYFGTNTGKVYRLDNANTVTSANANASTTDISGSSFPAGTVICVNTGTDDNNIIATYSNYGVNNVWITSDGGTTWSAIDGNLPDMPVRWAMFQPGTNRKIYLATEAGVYTTINANGASTVWLPEINFPTVSTYMLNLRASDSTIVAGTHGRGLWTAKIPPCIPAQINTQPLSNSFCEGSNATFTVGASGAIISYKWQVSTDNGNTWSDIPSSNNATLTVTGITLGMTGYQYRCILDTDCSGLLTTNAVTLTVSPTPTVNAVANQAVCSGSPTAAVTFSGSIPGTVYNWTNSNPAIGLAASGTGNIPSFTATNNTPGPISGTITVTPVYTGTATCSGTPITFTITVNSNLPLVIVAVPGTTLCQGDPAALTVYEQGPPVATTLTQSTSTAITQFNSVSCNAGGLHTDNSYWRAYNLATMGLSGPVTINTVTFGVEQAAGGPQPVTVNLYTQTTGTFPGGTRTLIATQNLTVPNMALSLFTGNFTTPVTVPNTATLIVELFTPSGQATGRSFFIGSNAAAQTGPSYLSAAACGVATPTDVAAIGFPNMHIILNLGGTTPGIGGIATGTFLWSPAAGLSSITSNPTAASPAVTTTYTVVRTTAAGCVGSASITLNVNTRPTITSQPANITACATSTVTFSVTGTGTGVGYQWQVSTTGAGGPWVNLANGAPYSGVTTPTLTINPVTVAMSGWRYRCVLNGTCLPLATENISNSALLTVNALPVVTISPSGQICGGSATSCNPITASGADSYIWSPITGLYLDCPATVPYTGTNAATVYPRPAVNTVYTVTGTSAATGCSNTATISVVYTPPAPTVVPSSATICLGGPAAQLSILAATPVTQTYSSGPISVAVPDASLTGASHVLNVPIPATAVISDMTVAFNMTHTWDGDMVIVLKSPNNNILNLDYYLSGTGGTGATTGFTNTRIGSSGTAALSTGANPYTNLFRADAVLTGPFGPAGPNGFIPNVTQWSDLWTVTPNGNYTLAMYDGGAGDVGTLTSWSITLTYTAGAPPPVNGIWTPATGLYTDANATIPYIANTPAQTVYANPATSTTYAVTVSSIGPNATQTFTNNTPITIPSVGIATPYPSNINVTGIPTNGASVQSVTICGISHTWSNDIDILLQSPTGQNVILMSDVGGGNALNNVTYTFTDAGPAMGTGVNATGTYHPTDLAPTDDWPAPGPGTFTQTNPALAMFTGNLNGQWKLFVVDDTGGDQGQIACGWSMVLAYPTPGCTSPARQVPVTVNIPVAVTTQPGNQTICTDKVATFAVTVTGTSPTYQWQESTDNGNTWTNIATGGVYNGTSTATLVITAPPVSMSGNYYRCVITGAAPCGSVASFQARLTVNPLPTVVIAANPYLRLMPGLSTTLTSTVSPNAAQQYNWLRNGANVGGNTATHTVTVDALGDYSLRVTDVNGCTNTSNTISIRDSVSSRCFIYPNPSYGRFEVRYYSVLNNSALPRTVTVYDTRGERVLTQRYSIGQPYDKMEVDMRKYAKGLYWVEIGDANGNRLSMCRIVIQ